jgi:hypothetical protein
MTGGSGPLVRWTAFFGGILVEKLLSLLQLQQRQRQTSCSSNYFCRKKQSSVISMEFHIYGK